MAAYFIVRCKYHDMDNYKKYAKAAAQAVNAFKGRFLVTGKGVQSPVSYTHLTLTTILLV